MSVSDNSGIWKLPKTSLYHHYFYWLLFILFCLLVCSVIFVWQTLYLKNFLLKLRPRWYYIPSQSILAYFCQYWSPWHYWITCVSSVRNVFSRFTLHSSVQLSLCPKPKCRDSSKPYLAVHLLQVLSLWLLKANGSTTQPLGVSAASSKSTKSPFFPLSLVSSVMLSNISIYI